MSTEKKSGISRYLIVLILLLPLVIWLGRVIVEGRLIWYFRAADLADMVILTPIYIAVLLYLWIYMKRHEASTEMLVAFGIFGTLFIFGQGLHVAGNTINTFMTEVRDYKSIMPKDAYALIFFIDEVLSHLVQFGAMIGLIAVWLAFDAFIEAPALLPNNRRFLLGAGLLFSGVLAYGLIEARTPYMIIAVVGVLSGLWIWLWRRSGFPVGQFVKDRPFRKLAIILTVGCSALMLAWALIFGGFVQPSELGL
jgi:hypothetical protein